MNDNKNIELIYSSSAKKDFKKKNVKYNKKYLKNKIRILKKNPLLGKELKSPLDDCYSLRVKSKSSSSYRCIYRYHRNKKIVQIICVALRKNVYDKAIRRI